MEAWTMKAGGEVAWDRPRGPDEEKVQELLREAMKLATPGRVVGLLAGLVFDVHHEAKAKDDETTAFQAWGAGQMLHHVGAALDRIFPSD
jgi:hypothetical protein